MEFTYREALQFLKESKRASARMRYILLYEEVVMNGKDLARKIVARQVLEAKELAAAAGVDEETAMQLVIAGVRLGAFQAGVMSAIGALKTLKEGA